MSAGFRACAVVPTLDNPRTVQPVVRTLREQGLEVFLVDDGSGPEGRAACEAAQAAGLVTLRRLAQNRGKGAAVKAGFALARELGFSHALQVDADGQHDLGRTRAFLEAAEAQPEALVLGYPVYGDDAPRARTIGRRFTNFWVDLEVGARATVVDSMIGFRVYPLEAALAVRSAGDRMEFDIEMVVRMVQAGTPTLNLPVGVRYLSAGEGGVSHFRMVRDNLRLSWLHTRLCTAGCLRWLGATLTGAVR